VRESERSCARVHMWAETKIMRLRENETTGSYVQRTKTTQIEPERKRTRDLDRDSPQEVIKKDLSRGREMNTRHSCMYEIYTWPGTCMLICHYVKRKREKESEKRKESERNERQKKIERGRKVGPEGESTGTHERARARVPPERTKATRLEKSEKDSESKRVPVRIVASERVGEYRDKEKKRTMQPKRRKIDKNIFHDRGRGENKKERKEREKRKRERELLRAKAKDIKRERSKRE